MQADECGVVDSAGIGRALSKCIIPYSEISLVRKSNSSMMIISPFKVAFTINLFLFLSLVQFFQAISILTSSSHIIVGQLSQYYDDFSAICSQLISKSSCILYFDFVATGHEQIVFKSRIRGTEF